MKGVDFKLAIEYRKGVKVLTEWHYRLTGDDGRVWDLYFNQNGRMTLGERGKNDSFEGISPESLCRKIGWVCPPQYADKPISTDLSNNNFSDV